MYVFVAENDTSYLRRSRKIVAGFEKSHPVLRVIITWRYRCFYFDMRDMLSSLRKGAIFLYVLVMLQGYYNHTLHLARGNDVYSRLRMSWHICPMAEMFSHGCRGYVPFCNTIKILSDD